MRIECYDISNFQGAQSVGSMVVFEEGRPRTGEYRRFQIKTVEGSNDFASHQEVLRRRFRGAKTGRGGDRGGAALGDAGPRHRRRRAGARSAPPSEVLDELGLGDLPLVGLAKEREELILPDREDPVLLPVTSQALYLVQRLRDEAHRFAITYHRSLRDRKARQVGVRRPAGRRPEAPPGAAQGVRVGKAGPGGARGADRGRARDRAGARGADQGPPRGLMPLVPDGTGATMDPIAEPMSRFASARVSRSGDHREGERWTARTAGSKPLERRVPPPGGPVARLEAAGEPLSAGRHDRAPRSAGPCPSPPELPSSPHRCAAPVAEPAAAASAFAPGSGRPPRACVRPASWSRPARCRARAVGDPAGQRMAAARARHRSPSRTSRSGSPAAPSPGSAASP